jgi:uncharacterized protein (DUF952 family)
MNEIVYKVMNRAAFTEAKAKGSFDGSAADRRDGFIHLSSADQLEGSLAKHFAGQKDLVLLAVDAARLGGGEEPLELGADGCYRLPLRVLP